MATKKAVTSQRDFSAGEVDVDLKRSDDHPMLKAGARTATNMRILNSRSMRVRPGRKALFRTALYARTEEITISPGNVFFLSFEAAACKIYDPLGALVFSSASFSWTQDTLRDISYTVFQRRIYICSNGQRPQVISWDGVATWTLSDYLETVTSGNQKRTFFYRISKPGVTMWPDAASGAVVLTFSELICVPGMVGSRMRYIGRQLLITGYTNAQTLTAQVQEPLPFSQTAVVAPDPRGVFTLGDAVIGSVSGARGVVVGLPDATHVQLQLIASTNAQTVLTAGLVGQQTDSTQIVAGFVATDKIVGPAGGVQASAITAAQPPQAVTIWDEEVFNGFRGFPRGVFSDQNRLGFCDFPSVPNGIGWSAIAAPNDLYVDAPPNAAMFELVPDQVRVRYVLAGPESNEFVFCDNKNFYIPISATNPLKPGSVAFNVLSTDGCAAVQPRAVEASLIYVPANGASVKAVLVLGAYYRPFETHDLTEFHAHLINAPVALAAPSAGSSFPERYLYVLNADGTVAAGKYAVEDGKIKGLVGWTPHVSVGQVAWIAALNASVVFSTAYAFVATPTQFVAERLDATLYLDGAVFVNNVPPALTPPPGSGPLWWLGNRTVTLMDGGTRMMGLYQVNDGFIVPQNNAGEDLGSAQLVAGVAFDCILEPFIPPVQAGDDVSQRMDARRLSRVQVYVANSTGFAMDRLASEQTGPYLPTPGTVMARRRVPAWNVGEDPTQPPVLREQSYLDRPLGRSHDPRWRVLKDTPGPLDVIEIATEVGV